MSGFDMQPEAPYSTCSERPSTGGIYHTGGTLVLLLFFVFVFTLSLLTWFWSIVEKDADAPACAVVVVVVGVGLRTDLQKAKLPE